MPEAPPKGSIPVYLTGGIAGWKTGDAMIGWKATYKDGKDLGTWRNEVVATVEIIKHHEKEQSKSGVPSNE